MDGLLVDSEPLWFEVEIAFARDRGKVWTKEDAKRCVGRGLLDTVRQMSEKFELSLEPRAGVLELVERFIARVGELRLKRGGLACLKEARELGKTALASSSPLHLIDAVVDRFGIRSYFDLILSGEQVEKPKPSPDIFVEAARILKVLPKNCIVLEDSLAGVEAGMRAGMRVCAVPEQAWWGLDYKKNASWVVADLVAAMPLMGLSGKYVDEGDRIRRCVLGLGSNVGDRMALLDEAVRRLRAYWGIEVQKESPVYETKPVGGPPQGNYLNRAVLIETAMAPEEVLSRVLEIEREMGRERREELRWGPRTIDIDLLWVEGVVVSSEELQVPHPRLGGRAFALRPLVDIAPDAFDPATGRAYADMLKELPGEEMLGMMSAVAREL